MKSCILILTLAAVSVAVAQDRPTVQAQPNSIYVGADGKYDASPDTAVLQFDISAQENESRAAYDRASKAAEQLRQILRSNGIDPKAAQIGYFSIQPIYDNRGSKPKLTAYRVNANVTLKLRDFNKVAPIVQQLSDGDITGTEQISYTLEDIDMAKTKAVEDAYRHAHDSANAVATAGGRTLGELSYASVDTYENVRVTPMASYAKLQRAPAAEPAPTEEFTPQTTTITAHVNAMFTLK